MSYAPRCFENLAQCLGHNLVKSISPQPHFWNGGESHNGAGQFMGNILECLGAGPRKLRQIFKTRIYYLPFVMAEALALFSSIAAVGTAADAALKISRWMFHIAKEIGGAQEAVERFADKIANFQLIIGAVHFALNQYLDPKDHSSLSPLMMYMKDRRIIKRLAETCDVLVVHIRSLKPRISGLQSKLSLISKLKWLACKNEVESMGPEMECVKTSMQLVLTLVQMEMTKSQQMTPEIQKEL